MTEETPLHLRYDRADPVQSLFRAMHCAGATEEHLRGLPDTPEFRALRLTASTFHKQLSDAWMNHKK